MRFAHQEAFESTREQTAKFWKSLAGARIFFAGGTGFFGASLLEGLLWAREAFDLDIQTVVLTRNKSAFLQRMPQFVGAEGIDFCEGEASSFRFPPGQFSHVIHGASSVALPGKNQDGEVEAALVRDTAHILECARSSGCSRFLYISSGAAYGALPTESLRFTEQMLPKPTTAYGRGKLQSEMLCLQSTGTMDIVVARGFAFVGPFLPLDGHFAIGNFIRSALTGTPIVISGDGTALRSYLFSADLAVWMTALMTAGRSGEVYNLGSDQEVSIRDLAQLVAQALNPSIEVQILKIASPGQAPDRYIPSTDKIRNDLGVSQLFDLRTAIEMTARWHQNAAR